MIQVLGWVANIFFIYGVWIIGDKNVKGFYLNALGNLFYAWQAPLTNNHPLFWLSILLIVINLKGIYQWQFQSKKSKLRKIFKKAQRNAGQKYNSELMKYIDREVE